MLVLFDLDGTLIDSAPDIHHAANLLLSDFGYAPLSLDEIRNMIGDGVANLVERALAARQHTSVDLAADVRRLLALYAANPTARTQLYPNVVTTLQRLRERGMTLTICTNKPIQLTQSILAELDLAHYFSAVLGGDSLPFRKPDPRMLQELLQRFETKPQDAVLVGDSEIDAAAAQAAGVPFILVTYGYHRGALDKIRSSAVVDDFGKLVELILT